METIFPFCKNFIPYLPYFVQIDLKYESYVEGSLMVPRPNSYLSKNVSLWMDSTKIWGSLTH